MYCQKCGKETSNGARMCADCGAPLSESPDTAAGIAGIRQGRQIPGDTGAAVPRRLPQPARYARDAGRPAERRGVASVPRLGTQGLKRSRENARAAQKFMVNWVFLATLLLALALLAAAGGFVWLKYTPPGQLMMARMGYESTVNALWTLGHEYLDQGYIEKAIQSYEKAYAQEPEREDIYQRLEDLADAYEAGQDMVKAESTYALLYNTVDPAQPAAYRNAIRIMLDQNRLFEATDLMRKAYTETGDKSFNSQREQYVPKMPTASKSAGRYLLDIDVKLQSEQEYDIYYTMGDGILPEAGTLYTGPLTLKEGSYTIRAVCISSDLVSDEMLIKYTITLPVPEAPKSRLAPGEYETRRKVYLYMADGSTDVSIYFTIDGLQPTADSPLYTGDPILLPGGRVTLRAIAVNHYGKASNELNNVYRINVPYKNYYRDEDDPFRDFSLLVTGRSEFEQKAGMPLSAEDIAETMIPGNAVKLIYTWGEARFIAVEANPVIYSLTTNSSAVVGPRGTRVGMTADDVMAKFRDMEQPANTSGSRSLYYDAAVGYGKYTPDSGKGAEITYVYLRADEFITTLTYTLTNNIVSSISVSVRQ
jgi:tetratricopeptide (TPR) repeat protein